jgi:cytochrome c-type biogenesis protein CcmH/NrfG
MTRLAEELSRRGMTQAAEDSYKRSLALAPDDVRTLVGLGDLMTRDGRADEAEPYFRRALGVQPNSQRATLGLINALIAQGDSHLDEASTALEGVLRDDPGSARAHYLMGLVHERRGEVAEAAGAYKKAAEILLGTEIGGDEK